MNIFVLDENPDVAATMHNDRHCIKMILETAQLLSTAHHVTGSKLANQLYRKTHENHPCAKWVRETKGNYLWAYELFKQLCKEYTFRYNKVHKTWLEKNDLLANVPELPDGPRTEFMQCVAEGCHKDNAVDAYRTYYKQHKGHIAQWKNRPVPAWWYSA